jgi:hypothetical protein
VALLNGVYVIVCLCFSGSLLGCLPVFLSSCLPVRPARRRYVDPVFCSSALSLCRFAGDPATRRTRMPCRSFSGWAARRFAAQAFLCCAGWPRQRLTALPRARSAVATLNRLAASKI